LVQKNRQNFKRNYFNRLFFNKCSTINKWFRFRKINRQRKIWYSFHMQVILVLFRHKKTGFVCALKIIKKDTIRKERSLEQLTR